MMKTNKIQSHNIFFLKNHMIKVSKPARKSNRTNDRFMRVGVGGPFCTAKKATLSCQKPVSVA